MRNIINISLPSSMVETVEKSIKEKHFATKSEFFRMLIRLWLEGKLAEDLGESRKELRGGKGKLLRSLKNLR